MTPPISIHLLAGDATTAEALRSVPVALVASGTAVVGEGALDRAAGEEVRRRLGAGEVVIVLAQADSAAAHYPLPVALCAPATQALAVDRGVLPSPVAGNLAVARVLVGRGPVGFPDRVVVGASCGTAVGSHQVGRGRLVFCQFELCARAVLGDGVGRAVLGELIRWAVVPRPTLAVEEAHNNDGRRVARYTHTWTVAR